MNAVPGVKWVGLLRGFAEHVKMTARDFLDHAAELYARAPILHLDLFDVAPHSDELFQSPLLARIVSLDITRANLYDAEVRALAASPHLGRLRWLDLSRNHICQAGLEALCASKGLPALRYLMFADNVASDPTPKFVDEPEWQNLDIPPVAGELQARFGEKAWLKFERIGLSYPPARNLV